MVLEHEAAIRESWALIRPAAAGVAHRFYDRLFELDPALRPLFHRSDPEALERKLVAALDEIVRLVTDPARLVSVIVPLGRRHAAYGVRPEHYAVVGDLHEIVPAINEELRSRQG